MPANIWTPTALASEALPWEGGGWRAVEAQHKVATMTLAHGSLFDQNLLENILEEVKPILPTDAQGLHWLLSTPFRYYPLAGGSRFRRRNDPGVFYGAEDRETASAESGYWRLHMWMDSEGLSKRQKAVPITLFEFRAAADKSIDLTKPPLSAERKIWAAPDNYSSTQLLADNAREAGVEAIRYSSVRNPGGYCLALMTPQVFRRVEEPYWNSQQTWTLLIEPPNLVVWQRDITSETWSFRF
ncbi:MAG: RES family NAD+ phosphorylase [Sulfuricellaceae bacterium]|nr:RES family NAD+ phosphorylase [Sulfuricellaceae bacterium]